MHKNNSSKFFKKECNLEKKLEEIRFSKLKEKLGIQFIMINDLYIDDYYIFYG